MEIGDTQHADYALVWHPPVEMLQGRDLKAVFARALALTLF
jgi:glyoxylate/hydroxypyruvate reductase A